MRFLNIKIQSKINTKVYDLWTRASALRFSLYPLLIGYIRFDSSKLDDTWNFILMTWLDHRSYCFMILYTSLIYGHYLFGFSKSSLPPVHTLCREEIRTSYKMSIQKISRDPDSFWLRWMSYVKKKERHKYWLKSHSVIN